MIHKMRYTNMKKEKTVLEFDIKPMSPFLYNRKYSAILAETNIYDGAKMNMDIALGLWSEVLDLSFLKLNGISEEATLQQKIELFFMNDPYAIVHINKTIQGFLNPIDLEREIVD